MNAQAIRAGLVASGFVITVLGVAPAAEAATEGPNVFSANVALTTNYMFRGVSQTGNAAAIQGGFDYIYKPWGLYAGVWGSNVDSASGTGYYYIERDNEQIVVGPDTPDAQYMQLSAPGYDGGTMELDLKAGWAPTWGKFGMDLGYLRYQYPGTKTEINNTNEYHLGLSYDLTYLTPKFVANYSPDWYGDGESWYYDLSVGIPLPYDFTLTGHYGWSRFHGNLGFVNYEDYSVGLSREFYGFGFNLSWVDRTNTDACVSPFDCGSTAVFTLSKVF
jgi:hypothetical protein